MTYDKKCPRFVDPVRGWVKGFQGWPGGILIAFNNVKFIMHVGLILKVRKEVSVLI